MDLHAYTELMLGGLVVIAAMLFAMPQFTTFAVATAYVLSGPLLMARGERIAAFSRTAKPGANESGNGPSAAHSEPPAWAS
jgi:hypothetical protein